MMDEAEIVLGSRGTWAVIPVTIPALMVCHQDGTQMLSYVQYPSAQHAVDSAEASFDAMIEDMNA